MAVAASLLVFIGTGIKLAFRYSGCAGSPDLFILMQYRFGSAAFTTLALPRWLPSLPQAATTMPAFSERLESQISFSKPTGSLDAFMSPGSVARNANRFAIQIPPYPQDFAKFMHRMSVGSSSVSSAVDGFNPTIIAYGLEASQVRQSA